MVSQILLGLLLVPLVPHLAAQQSEVSLQLNIPKAWETDGVATLELPPPVPGLRRIQASPDQYYKLPVRAVLKSYPVYHPDKEPPGYLEWLKQREPESAVRTDELRTKADWIRAGEILFDSPSSNNGRIDEVRDPAWYTRTGVPVAKAGYYKVPSLKGVWYRGPFEHNGSVARLEDWFDPARLRDGYVPTGYKGYGVKTRAVRGHEFGLKLTAEDKTALIAFLKTL